MDIRIVKDDIFGYTLLVDGVVLMECLSAKDVDELSIREIKNLVAMNM